MKRKKLIAILLSISIGLLTCNGFVFATENNSPFTELEEEYKTGKKVWDAGTDDFSEAWQNVLDEFADILAAYSDYVTLHTTELAEGKRFCELEDYEENLKPWYEWVNKIVYFKNEDVPEDYREAWNCLKLMATNCRDMLDKSYTEENADAANTLNELFNYITTESGNIHQLVPSKEITIGSEIVVDEFAKVVVKDLIYTTRINPSDTSGIYSYYECSNADNEFLALHFDFTNLQTEAGYKLEDYITAQVVFDGGYAYQGWTIAEDGGRLSSYPNLIPLSTFDSWYLIEVPKTLEGTSFDFNITVGQKSYVIRG